MAGNIVIRNANILPGNFRNFAGEPDKFNPDGGKRKFVVGLTGADVQYNGETISDMDILRKDGWRVNTLSSRDPEDPPTEILNVKIKFGKVPPKIIQVTSSGKVQLDEETVKCLDWAEIIKADVSIRPYEWEPGHISAYLKTLYVQIEEDEFESDYADVAEPVDEEIPF